MTRRAGIVSNILYKLYGLGGGRMKRAAFWLAAKTEGGEMLSHTLRRICRDYHDVEIGMYSYGGCFNLMRIGNGTKIGRYCSFADSVWRFNGNHPMTFRSMHPYFYEPYYG